jgi:glycerophosphoryl diester phosphodiesterase
MVAPDHSFPGNAFPLIVAHRGSPVDRPENTLPSFERAIELGAGAIELDVRITADGVPVVMHDPTVDRTTDGSGPVHELTAKQVRRLRARGEVAAGVPTLAEVLALASGRAAVAIEIKNIPGEPGYDPGAEPAVEGVHAELERTGFRGPALVISFSPSSIEASRRLAPAVPTGLLTTDRVDPREALAYATAAGHAMVLPGSRALDRVREGFVAEAHGAGLRVGTWTVDEPAAVERYLGWGVDAVASNDPAMALAVLGRG